MSDEKIRSYRDLQIWRLGIEVVKDVYRVTTSFPKQEVYGLVGQMRRAAVSIPSNIAEGFRRFHKKEYRQHLYVTLGSCAELETQITIARELKYVTNGVADAMLDKLDHLCRMTVSLIKRL